MKRIILILLCISMLTGCSALVPDSYTSVTPHQIPDNPAVSNSAAEVSNYHGLKVALLNQIRTGRPEGIIHASNYDGNVEEDLKKATYEVSTANPLGAYAVEYMTHSCSLLVSYYEIRVSITYRRSPQEIAKIQSFSTMEHFRQMLTDAVDDLDHRIAVQISDYDHEAEDVATFIAEYCISNPATVMEIPGISVSVYPEKGKSRIVEVSFAYKNTPQGLQAKRRAVDNSINAAVEYIRYRQEDYDKVQLLYSYLTQRFHYRKAETVTPLYDALCSGIADDTGLAQAWKLICDKAGVECFIVSGVKNGQPYTWNILRTGTHYRHLDPAQCFLSRSGLVMQSDGQMTAYSWDTAQFPACKPLPAVQPEEKEETPSTDAEVPPAEEPAPPTEDSPDETPAAPESPEEQDSHS